jgi:hypothetical protein
MNRITIITLCLAMLSFSIYSQNARKGYKWLEKLEYDKAKSLFDEMLLADSKNPSVHFGLALIYSDEKSPYFDLIQAWSNCIVLKNNFDKLVQDDLDCIGEYFSNTEQRPNTRPVKKKIEYAVSVIEAHLIKYVREENNLELTYKVIHEFPDFPYYANVIHIRNQLEFRKYEKQNTLEGYIEFIEKFPDAAQLEKAIGYRNRLAFEKACSINTTDAYNIFMLEYPDAPEYNQAVKKKNEVAFDQAKRVNTMKSYEDFIATYPDALEVAEAKSMLKQLLFEYARKIKTLEAYNEFIQRYPEGQQYIDIFNLKSLDLGMKYLTSSSINSDKIQWARSYDLENGKEGAGSFIFLSDSQCFMAVTTKRNDTLGTDIWMLGLDSDGKMLWNKTTGGNYNDEIYYAAVNHKNEIILAGYSWISPDPASREIWLLKQARDGRNIWSIKLGKWVINTLMIDRENNIVLGGYESSDTLGNHYRIMVLNDLGRKLWSRTYSGPGTIQNISPLPDNTMLMVTQNWICRMDIRGYIRWEYIPPVENAYFAGQTWENGDFIIGGITANNAVLSKFGLDGKKKWDKKYALSDTLTSIKKMIRIEPGKLLLLAQYKNSGSAALWVNAVTGEMLKNTWMGDITVNDMQPDSQKNLWIMVEEDNEILIKYKGCEFY